MILRDLGEFNLIDRIKKDISKSSSVIKGIGDDTAVLRYKKGKFLLFTIDMLIEGRHFTKKLDPYLVGKKALSVSISDIASMGGIPTNFLVSLGVKSGLDVKYIDRLYRGMKDVAKRFNINLVGGDTVKSEKIIIDIALLGEVKKKDLTLRSNAKDKDLIFLTGDIGGSIKNKHFNFTPRIKEAQFLVKNFKISSMIDVSDGLSQDLGHILKASSVGGVIHEEKIPLSKDARDFNSSLSDGEDFELVFTLPKKEGLRLMKIWPFKTRLSNIGEITSSNKGIMLVLKDGKISKLKVKGYTHF
ncbi:MAG: thiamine-phosphate kinase [Candidatus Omnitrophota bacterium]